LNKLTGGDTGGAFLLTEIDIPPGGGPPLHRHTREDELFIVLEGELAFRVGEQTLHAKAGAVVFGPRGLPHTFKNCTGQRVRAMVFVTSPVSEGFFRSFGEPLPGTTAPPPDDVIIERIMKLAPEYGIEILGPCPL